MNSFSYYLKALAKVPRVLKQFGRIATYVLNDENYWDEYARGWQAQGPDGSLQCLGDEWSNQQVFLELLRKSATKDLTGLEIGCGGGRITAHAVGWLRHVHACDVSGRMLARCRQSLPASNVSFHKLDGFTLKEFADSSLDLVYSHDVFVHFSSLQVYPYLREVQRVLKPGAFGLISFLSFGHDFEDFKETSLRYWSRRWFPPHMRLHFITEEMLTRMLDDVGLQVREISRKNYLIALFRK